MSICPFAIDSPRSVNLLLNSGQQAPNIPINSKDLQSGRTSDFLVVNILDASLLKKLSETEQEFLLEVLSLHSPSLQDGRLEHILLICLHIRFKALEEQLNHIAECALETFNIGQSTGTLLSDISKKREEIIQHESIFCSMTSVNFSEHLLEQLFPVTMTLKRESVDSESLIKELEKIRKQVSDRCFSLLTL